MYFDIDLAAKRAAVGLKELENFRMFAVRRSAHLSGRRSDR